MARTITGRDRALAQVCKYCPVCRRARNAQSGALYHFVRFAESKFCPFCKAYGRVYGKPAHQPGHGAPH